MSPEIRNLTLETTEGDLPPRRFCMPKSAILILGVVLFFLHQDYWNWGDRSLVFGFLPIGLAYHALYSIAAALFWAYAIRVAWPSDYEAWAEKKDDVS